MAKVYYGNYGHNPKPNGKKYAYIGSNQYQVGQNVVAPVTHYISGKNYKTMFTIQDQADANSQQAENTIVELENMRKTLKSLDGTNVMELPGAAKYPSAEAWKQASEDIAQGKYRAAERLQKGQSESPVKATAEDLKVRQEQRLQGEYFERHQQYLDALRKYQDKLRTEQMKQTPEYQMAKRQALGEAFERYKLKETDDRTFKREITRALTNYAPFDYYEVTDADKGVDLLLESMKKGRQTAIERLKNYRR